MVSISAPLSFDDYVILLNPADGVGIAKQPIPAEAILQLPDGSPLRVHETIPPGHKLSLAAIRAGESIYRYGYPIGQATADIPAGSWVHTHNLDLGALSADHAVRVVEPLAGVPSARTFLGYPRPDGKVGTRNYLALISTVNCSAHVVSQIARAFPPERLRQYENVDGVIPILHHSGCSMAPGGASYRYLKRVLNNLGSHPNIAAAVWVGLGCEVMQVGECSPLYTADEFEGSTPRRMVIQEQGGFQKTVEAGIELIESLLPQVNAVRREPQPLSKLVAALQCGGSDGWSGVTANPLVGRIADSLAAEGGTAILAETPEIYGAEQLLLQRVTSIEVANKLNERVRWWSKEARQRGFSLNNNPTPGNKQGGLTTIAEKSLGAVAKGGNSPLTAVYEYGEMADQPGLVFMDTPGNDPMSITGQLAGGSNLILFTTGRGSVFGSTLAPCVKIASSQDLYERMVDDMDFNAGQLLHGTTWEVASQELLELILAVASGQRTHSERHGLSENEFVPWQPDAVL